MQQVLVFNFTLKLLLRKLKSRWRVVFLVAKVYPHDVVDIQNLKTQIIFKVKDQRLNIILWVR